MPPSWAWLSYAIAIGFVVVGVLSVADVLGDVIAVADGPPDRHPRAGVGLLARVAASVQPECGPGITGAGRDGTDVRLTPDPRVNRV